MKEPRSGIPASHCLALLLITFGFAFGFAQPPEDPFPIPQDYRPFVDFWIDVFTRYSGRQILIHDAEEPWRILKILEFDRVDPLQEDLTNAYRDILAKHLKQVRSACLELADQGPKAACKSPLHHWLWQLYGHRAHREPDLFRRVADRLRLQRGMREKMRESLWRMDFYLPHVRRIFERSGMPRDLAYLALVESGYNPYAGSFAGARGMWQFIRRTARRHGLIVGRYIDQRYDPLYSTEAAVRYLAGAYRRFGRWPLAVTSYNHGVEGIARAIRELGTRDWSRIRKEYRGPYFGFASKNFYAEFLAAREIVRKRYIYFPDSRKLVVEPWEFAVYRLPRTVSIRRIPRSLGMSTEEFIQYNPQFLLAAFIRDIRVLASTKIRIPVLEKNYGVKGLHVVRPGETLKRIARVYGVTVPDLLAWNPEMQARRLLPGRVIRLRAPEPPHSERTSSR